jgi:peptidoglycan hydrolase-like protein with peptidoglycan-binding domain
MHDIVRDSFYAFSEPMEGEVSWMYTDHLGKVTVGIGNLIDSPTDAWRTRELGAPFFREGDGAEATYEQVDAAWHRVKNDGSVRGKAQMAKALTDLRLTPDGIAALLASTLAAYESTLKEVAEFAVLEDWPADAQLGLFSMAWAMGPWFAHQDRWPAFRGACGAADWLTAARQCNMSNSWLVKRNAVNRGLFRNAAYTVATNADPSELFLAVPGNMPVLKLGVIPDEFTGQGFDSDEPIATLEGFLSWLGFDPGAQDDWFDDATHNAVAAFQRHEHELTADRGGFTVDGIVGRTTWAALGYVVPRA